MTTSIATTVAAVRERLAQTRAAGPVGLVPTMGALHQGHVRLIERARADCATVVVSIFVNPLQFDREEDLRRYPRTLEQDVRTCEAEGVDIVFAPEAAELYPAPPRCTVHVEQLADHLCGRFRPGHFAGVATVVLKLLQITQPDLAYFGEKDAQQLAIVRQLVRDFNVPVGIVGVPIVREVDGLAISSRNQLLDARERAQAPALYRALLDVERQVAAGTRDAGAITREVLARFPETSGVRFEYLEIVDPESMQPLQTISGPVLAAGALWVGSTRLIDNVLCHPPERAPR
jgi:pantoate--beta-alanine ligase